MLPFILILESIVKKYVTLETLIKIFSLGRDFLFKDEEIV